MSNTYRGVDKLISDMRGLISSTLLSDVVITTKNGTRVPAHAVILACRCPALGLVCITAYCYAIEHARYIK